MRTARFVIALILLAVLLPAFPEAQDDTGNAGELDREITLVGRDEALLPLPEPATAGEIPFPELDTTRLASTVLSPISGTDPGTPQNIILWLVDPLGDSFSR